MLRTGAQFIQNFQDAPQGSAILFEIFRMLRTGARQFSKFSGCSAQERDFIENFQAEHGSAILNDKVDESYTDRLPGYSLKTAMLNDKDDLERSTPVVTVSIAFVDFVVHKASKFSECSARERHGR